MYPVHYEADYQRDRNRLTTFFRLIVAIPWIFVALFYGIAAMFVILIAWFALIILGRFPQGMYNFVGGVLRYSMRVNAFVTLQTDAWPPFGLSDDQQYPVRIHIAPPAAKQSRLKVFFRYILAIPVFVMSMIFSYLVQYIAAVAWFTIVFRGYQPAAIHNALAFTNGWVTRANAYVLFMRDEYPPVGDEVQVDVDPPAALPAATPEAAVAAPVAAAPSEQAPAPETPDPGIEAPPQPPENPPQT